MCCAGGWEREEPADRDLDRCMSCVGFLCRGLRRGSGSGARWLRRSRRDGRISPWLRSSLELVCGCGCGGVGVKEVVKGKEKRTEYRET